MKAIAFLFLFAAWIGAAIRIAAETTFDGGLILNGSFEDGNYTGGSWTRLLAGDTALTSWTIGGVGVDWHDSEQFQFPFDGDKAVDLNLDGGTMGMISQSFATTPGSQYLLTFYLSGPGVEFGFPDPREVEVTVAGMDVIFSEPASSNTDMVWGQKQLTFTADATTTTVAFSNVDFTGYWGPVLDAVSVVGTGTNLTLLSAASRLRHSSAGTFDIDMPLAGESGVENRCSGTYTAVFLFDGPVTSGDVGVVSGTASVGTVTGSGNELLARVKDVTDVQIVTLRVSNINGDGQQHGDVAFGFLLGDVDANRVVDRPDRRQINLDKHQTVTASNFRDDIDRSGVVDVRDLHGVTSHLGNSLP